MPSNEDRSAALDADLEVEEPSGPIECPKCHTRMKSIAVDELAVHKCQSCGGLWLDAIAKERLLADRKAVKSIDTNPAAVGKRLDDVTDILCPLDHSAMIRRGEPGQRQVHYESCTVCGGVFFDAGELTELSKVSLGKRLRSLLG